MGLFPLQSESSVVHRLPPEKGLFSRGKHCLNFCVNLTSDLLHFNVCEEFGTRRPVLDNCVLRYLQAMAKDPNLRQMKDLSEQFQISSQGITTPHPCARDQHRKQPKKNENPMTLSSAQSPP